MSGILFFYSRVDFTKHTHPPPCILKINQHIGAGMVWRYTLKSHAMTSGMEESFRQISLQTEYGTCHAPARCIARKRPLLTMHTLSQHPGSYEDPLGPLGCINLHPRAKVHRNEKSLHQFENWLHRQKGVFIAHGALKRCCALSTVE
jgi:hypothetical protein